MLTIVWEFRVRPGGNREFERYYGAAGQWVALFRRADGYRGTQLLRDADDPARYLTLDFWRDEEAYRRFQQVYAADYAALDVLCANLTTEERRLGHFAVTEG